MISSCHEYDPVEKDAPNDRKQFSPHIARGCSGQLTDLRDDGQGGGEQGHTMGQPTLGSMWRSRPMILGLTGRVHDGDALGPLYRSRLSGQPYA
jgi:hypothetical protein